MRLGESDKAVADYTTLINRSVQGSGGQAGAYTRRGIAHAMRGENMSARDDFENVSAIESKWK